MIGILIVDPQKSVRARLEEIINSTADFQLIGTAEDGFGAIAKVDALRPDIVLLNIEMPQLDGLTITRIIAQECKQTKIIVFSSHNNEEYIAKSIAAGATGYLLKGTSDEEIQQAIRFVHKGCTHIGAGLFETLPLERKTTLLSASSISEAIVNSSQTSVAVLERSPAAVSPVRTNTTPEPNKNKWSALAWLIIALSLTTGIYLMRQWLRKPLPALSLSEQTATFADTKFTGKIQPAKTFKIAAIAPAVVDEIYVQIGEEVEASQPLMVLKNAEAEAQMKQILQERQLANQQQQGVIQQQQNIKQRIYELEQQIGSLKYNLAPLRTKIAEANLEVSLAQSQADKLPLRQRQDSVARTKALYERALARFNRWNTLNKQGAISQEQLEQALADLKVAKIDFETAQAAAEAGAKLEQNQKQLSLLQEKLAVKEQEEQIAQLEKQLQAARLEERQASEKLTLLRQQATQLKEHQIPEANKTITATEAGIVAELPVTSGDRIFTGNPLVSLAKLERLKVEVPVSGRLINALTPKQQVAIQIGEGVTAQKFEGTIATVNPLPAENLNYLVEVEFDNLSNALLIGQLAKVQFLPQEIAGGN
ncbi:response regulator [Myxosarcina sp. GI1]|uniref:response regulator n=1 Tax=Myxosarcina sp. GI1 TaxID=1541065 RepID=UPI000689613D|nr:response regulator [Myxosarcina sp. GI1]